MTARNEAVAFSERRKAVPPFLAGGISRHEMACRHKLEVPLMNALLLRARHLLVSEDGPTAVEYAVMLALIVVVCLGTITTIGTSANGTFNTISNALPAAS